jgi:hypothetical protein
LHTLRVQLSSPLLALALMGLAAACGSVTPDDVGEEQPGVLDRRFGLVVLSYSDPRDTLGTTGQLTGSAWFVEHELATRDEVLGLLSVPLLGARSPVAEGTCRLTERPVPAEGAPTGAIYFMDAGPLTVESEGRGMGLESAYFPDVYPEVSGLVYDGLLVNGRPVVQQDGLRVIGHGSDEVGPFGAVLAPPPRLRLTSVGGHRVALGRVPVALDGADLVVTWGAPERDAEAVGPVVIELVRRGFDHLATLSCSAPDTGRFALPGELVAELPGFGADQTDRLQVYRYSAAAFDADGLGEGLVLVVARDAVFIQ